AAGSRVSLRSVFGDTDFLLPLPGDYNAANAALVIACLCARGVEIGRASQAVAESDTPPGRMQRVAAADDAPDVFVDYAHTPDALAAALTALREHTAGKLWCVFGCGGDRDAGKRPLMGRIAEQAADRIVVTNDNPRGESPAAILDDVLAGLTNPAAARAIEDRGEAIDWAIANAAADDVVLIAGKGHEDYQLVDDRRLDFSDDARARQALASRSSREPT
ncbi:MAG: cyanophycin synthetase, partial [Pseudomonadota bacterium]